MNVTAYLLNKKGKREKLTNENNQLNGRGGKKWQTIELTDYNDQVDYVLVFILVIYVFRFFHNEIK
jgi:hypothetical protein